MDREYKDSPEVMADLCLYTIDTGYLYENLDIMDDWKSSYLTISYKPNQKFTTVLSASWLDRFNEADSNFGLGFYADLSSSLNAYFGVTLTPGPHFSPLKRYDVDLALKARDPTDTIQAIHGQATL